MTREMADVVIVFFLGKKENPHKFNLNPGFVTVGEHGDVVNHYAFRREYSLLPGECTFYP